MNKATYVMTNEAVELLLTIKHRAMIKNDTHVECAGMGIAPFVSRIDNAIKAMLTNETNAFVTAYEYKIEHEENTAYSDLLEGLTPDILNEDEKKQLNDLAKEILRKADEEAEMRDEE